MYSSVRFGMFACGGAVVAIFLLGVMPCRGLAEPTPDILQQFPQAMGMAGYVLNAETNMNRTYSRELEQQLLPLPNTKLEEPLIQFEGPPRRMLDQPNFLLNAPKPGALQHLSKP